MVTTRLVELDDAEALAALLVANREFLAPYEPDRPDGYLTARGQRADIEAALGKAAAGTGRAHVIVDEQRVVGRIDLNTIVRGAFQSCSLGYWVGEADNGRGVASAAVAHMVAVAFGELGLHRVEAATLVHNRRSQRVLLRNGFEQFGLAPSYLKIAGDWRDHVLFQLLSQ